ncbi:peptide-methionine (R)-S-oxide reductase MsrB [Histidinibacterium lentulum]|uniref:peptide-methionine (R)-S-oxide reductase n=1 Tax=Histidinibacterium lentulum TaxID=2480588 RepID=A0A3N2R4S5_9RHOB|nr:peptide-methionine (R)-S-oxide reductase MsrB [Histidinibacterium lentulum]ROU02489.1 peptide-methionine (R)-S-oxide reductase [Histidinibacterium lentulum]
MPRRRTFLTAGAAAALVAATGGLAWRAGRAEAAPGDFPLSLTEAEWRTRLTEEEFRVLRDHGTERPYSSPLDAETREGLYACAGCGQEVYSSEAKYDSGTGWPSFWAPLSEEAIGTSTDYKLIYPRTEVHCSNCGGHLGHIFDDGPPPTGKRHCLNGVALEFRPAAA